MKKKYFFQRRLIRWLFYGMDFFFLFFRKKRSQQKLSLRKILVCHSGHLGDAVMATAVLPVLKNFFPSCQIGFLTTPLSSEVFKMHPLVDEVYQIEHWKLNREKSSFWKKYKTYRQTYTKALREVRSQHYDVGLDLSPYFPSSSFFLWRANVSKRVGYTSGGFGPLFTDPVPWEEKKRYRSEGFKPLLEKIGIHFTNDVFLEPHIAFKESKKKFFHKYLEKKYLVFHPGSGRLQKEWTLEKWRELTKRCAKDFLILFTGQGKRETFLIEKLIEKIPNTESLCGKLSFEEFSFVLKRAKLLVSVDTSAMHIAGALKTPCVALFCGIEDPAQWAPPGSFVLMKKNLCRIPCQKGCEEMRCIREISVEDVLQGIEKSLKIGKDV